VLVPARDLLSGDRKKACRQRDYSYEAMAKFIKRFQKTVTLIDFISWLIGLFIAQGTIARQTGSGKR